MKSLIALFLMTASLSLFAAGELKVSNAKIRLTPPNAPATAIFLSITNHTDKDLKLVDVKGEFAGVFELHTMEMADEKMVMRKVESIEIKKHQTAELKSGGLHIMVFKVKAPLKEGEKHKLNLIFDDKSNVVVEAQVTKN